MEFNNEKGIKIMKTLFTIISWIVVMAGFFLYGLTMLIDFLYPKPHDPMEDFNHIFDTKGHIISSIVIALLVIAWWMCWEFIKEERKTKRERNNKRRTTKC